MRNSGKLIQNKDGKIGRTFNNKGLINNKVPVYFATTFKTMKDGYEYPSEFSKDAILCDPQTLKIIGYVD